MPWRQLHDIDNQQNRNAGNGGDLAKHTVYLAVLNYLLARSPWSSELRVRECHAGRGMYRIDDARRALLETLYAPHNADVGVLLHDVQRKSQTALGVWPAALANFEWYSGSAIVNACQLESALSGRHLLELYELAGETRTVLRAACAALGRNLHRVDVRIMPERENDTEFDGESHIEQCIANWNTQDVVLLDPFAMWRDRKDQACRDRYRRILDHLIRRGEESPSLLLFWTWGHNFPVADGDLSGTNDPVRNGYQDLRNLLHQASKHFIRVTWRWGLQFAMWVVVPSAHLDPLSAEIQLRCDELRDHLLRLGRRVRLANPNIQVLVD